MTQPLTKCRPEGAAFAPLLGNTVELILLARVWVDSPQNMSVGKLVPLLICLVAAQEGDSCIHLPLTTAAGGEQATGS